jgi:hypothetical protein
MRASVFSNASRYIYSTALVAALQKKHGSNLKEVLNEAIAGL